MGGGRRAREVLHALGVDREDAEPARDAPTKVNTMTKPVTPETLTDAMVRDLLDAARTEPDGFEQGNTLVGHCGVWLQWNRGGERDHNEYNAREAARVIAHEINARAKDGK